MARFEIRYGLGGGYNDIQTEIIEVDNLEEAVLDAFNAACEMFESYDVFGNVNPDYNYDFEGYEEEYNEERERWIAYSARPLD